VVDISTVWHMLSAKLLADKRLALTDAYLFKMF